jgi:hypothetical protein
MGLLEKATLGIATNPPGLRNSLFSRAMLARETVPTAIDIASLDDLRRDLEALPPYFDSILHAWSLVSERAPIASVALFLPGKDRLVLCASKGFAKARDGSVALSLIGSLQKDGEALDPDACDLVAPIIGLSSSFTLRAATLRMTSNLAGLWVYGDPAIDMAESTSQAAIGTTLAGTAQGLPALPIAEAHIDPALVLLDAARKYHSASVFVFDLSSFGGGVIEQGLKGLRPSAIRSSFIAACVKILSQSGLALPFGENSVGCILGAASSMDPDLALFQFSKTMKRILPYLAALSFPEGRALHLDPFSENALGELSRFLSD